jgi:hypothetical protein
LFALAVPVIFGLALPLAMAQVRFIDPLRYAIRSRKPAAAEGGDGPGLTVPQVN